MAVYRPSAPSAVAAGRQPADTVVQDAPSTLWLAEELRVKSEALAQVESARRAILQLSDALVGIRDRATLAARLLVGVCDLVGADNGSILLLDASGKQLDIVADVGLPEEARGQKVPVENSISGMVLKVGEPLLLHGRVLAQSAAQRDLHCSMVVPITSGEKREGVVTLNIVREGAHFDNSDLEFVATVVVTFGAALESIRLDEQSRNMLMATIKALVLMVEAKDPYTRGHCDRIAVYGRGIAMMLGLPSATVNAIEMGGTLHDIGKVGVPESILLKPGKLTAEEYEVIKRHPVLGAEILAPVGLSRTTYDAVLCHHERMDGKGYPDGLVGEAIPLSARILAVADAFDSITSVRPYRSARGFAQAVDELRRSTGTQCDPEVVEAFFAYCEQEHMGDGTTKVAAFL